MRRDQVIDQIDLHHEEGLYHGDLHTGNIIVDIADEKVRDRYGRDLVLIRPDQHVAWRGNAAPADSDALIARATGAA